METNNETTMCTDNEAKPENQMTFHNVQSEPNVVRGEVVKDGQTHTIYVLAVPESNLKNYSYETHDRSAWVVAS